MLESWLIFSKRLSLRLCRCVERLDACLRREGTEGLAREESRLRLTSSIYGSSKIWIDLDVTKW